MTAEILMADNGKITEQKSGERIAKVIARAGLASRREAEQWIAAKRVTVNGAVIASPALDVSESDRISVDGKPLPTRERTRLFLYHKPRGLLTTHADDKGRPTIFGALPKELPRLVSVGRLDLNTEGLLLLTNDGGLARVLELPETGWLRRYRVRALGRVTQVQLDGLRRGIEIDGIRYGSIEAALDREQGSNVWVTFAMREGKNREVKNVLGHLGLAVNRLIRVSFGPFQLGDLAVGAVEEVKTRVLREQLGERITKRAGTDFSAAIVERTIPRNAPASGEDRERRSKPASTRSPSPPQRGRDGKPQRGSEGKRWQGLGGKPSSRNEPRGRPHSATVLTKRERDGKPQRGSEAKRWERAGGKPPSRNESRARPASGTTLTKWGRDGKPPRGNEAKGRGGDWGRGKPPTEQPTRPLSPTRPQKGPDEKQRDGAARRPRRAADRKRKR